ncbi:MAG: hypothetical protein IJ532_02440 [Alphaproteobacteria bacterium]|nr:hypothetical protein [Alphaproteobacteria bacterium]
MIGNPFAEIFKNAFKTDVLQSAVYTPTQINRFEPRVKIFMDSLNRFMRTSGQTPIMYQRYLFDEHKLFEYALFLRGYMRDAQTVLSELKQKHAVDSDLINLFEASSQYVVACNNHLKDKRIFNNNVNYCSWKIDLSAGLQQATYSPVSKSEKNRHNLYLFMPFRLKDNEQMLNTWIYKNMRNSLDNLHIFGEQVDTCAVFYPIQKSRCSNVTSLLKTLKYGDGFYEPEDLQFVKNHWADFIAKNIKFNNDGKICAAEKYSSAELNNNFRNITIFSYCAGTANAHRCLNVLYLMTSQIYGEKTAQDAMRNVFVTSYGFLPPREKLYYSGVHFYSHKDDDTNCREPFVNLNNHELYEKTKCRKQDSAARISVMPDMRNYIIALKIPEKTVIYNNKRIEKFDDAEYGHNLNNVNTVNLASPDNYAHKIFKSVLEKSSMGKRGKNVLQADNRTADFSLLNSAVIGRRQYL